MSNQAIYEVINNQILEELKKGVSPWKVPYNKSIPFLGSNKSIDSNNFYTGVNAFITFFAAIKREFDSQYWGTFNQWKKQGKNIKKGEKGIQVLFFKTLIENEGKENESEIPMARYFTVFNECQIDGYQKSETPALGKESNVEEFLKNSKLSKIDIFLGRPSYSPVNDVIFMPKINDFHSIESYYSTLFHELVHATGHKERLNRETLNNSKFFSDHLYSKEELIAELGSIYLQNLTNVQGEFEQSVSYCDQWYKILKNDPKLFVSAASQAQKAIDYIRL